jgi:Tol biopolymer transport system component
MRLFTNSRRVVAGSLIVVSAVLATTVSPVAATYPGANGKLAFAMRDADGNAQINVAEPDGTGVQQLTSGAYFHACAAWSADGTRIAYCSNETGPFEIWTMNADGSNQAQLTKLGGSATWPDFSPDGTKVSFDGTQGTDTYSQIRTVDTATGATVTVLTSCVAAEPKCSNTYAAWSPDGTQIAYIHATDADADGNPLGEQVWVMNADGSNPHALTTDAPSKDQVPDWSPDGSKIAFQSAPSGRSGGLWVMNADGSDAHQVAGCTTTDPMPCATGDIFGAAWSPDGQYIAYVSASSDQTDRPVMIVNADGSNPHRLTAGKAVQFVPGWQPLLEPNASPGASPAGSPAASAEASPAAS